MKLIKTEDAVGCMLCHDITQIIPGVVKDAVVRKGHVVTREDIPVLLSVGKEHLYVWEKQEGMLHEDEAAEILRSVCQNAQMDKNANPTWTVFFTFSFICKKPPYFLIIHKDYTISPHVGKVKRTLNNSHSFHPGVVTFFPSC